MYLRVMELHDTQVRFRQEMTCRRISASHCLRGSERGWNQRVAEQLACANPHCAFNPPPERVHRAEALVFIAVHVHGTAGAAVYVMQHDEAGAPATPSSRAAAVCSAGRRGRVVQRLRYNSTKCIPDNRVVALMHAAQYMPLDC